MFRSIYRTHDGQVKSPKQPVEIKAALRDKRGMLWVDLYEEPGDDFRSILLDVFEFHPLAVEDALEQAHVPRVDDWDSYLYTVLHGISLDSQDITRLTTYELDIFMGRNYLVTYHYQPIAAVERLWKRRQGDPRNLEKGPSYLLYRIAEELVDDYLPLVEQIDDVLEDIESSIFVDPKQTLLEQVFDLKRVLLRLRRVITPQREVINQFARGDYPLIEQETRIFFRDVYDHLVLMHDIIENLRDLVAGIRDTYLSVVNNRMNDIMKTLTIITTLFLPLTFLNGFFGMNFFFPANPIRAWMTQPVFVGVIAIMLALPFFMFIWMRRHSWM